MHKCISRVFTTSRVGQRGACCLFQENTLYSRKSQQSGYFSPINLAPFPFIEMIAHLKTEVSCLPILSISLHLLAPQSGVHSIGPFRDFQSYPIQPVPLKPVHTEIFKPASLWHFQTTTRLLLDHYQTTNLMTDVWWKVPPFLDALAGPYWRVCPSFLF